MAELKTNKITRKYWVEDSNGNRLTPKFKTQRSSIQSIQNYVVIYSSSIGRIVFHTLKDEIVLMDHNSDILIGYFMMLTRNLFVALIKPQNDHTTFWLYNEKAEFLGDVECVIAFSRLTEFAYDAGIPVVKDGKKYFVNYLGEVC